MSNREARLKAPSDHIRGKQNFDYAKNANADFDAGAKVTTIALYFCKHQAKALSYIIDSSHLIY